MAFGIGVGVGGINPATALLSLAQQAMSQGPGTLGGGGISIPGLSGISGGGIPLPWILRIPSLLNPVLNQVPGADGGGSSGQQTSVTTPAIPGDQIMSSLMRIFGIPVGFGGIPGL